MAPESAALDEEADVWPGLGVAAGAIAPPLAAAAAAAASPPPSAAGVWAPLRSLLTPLPFALLRAGAASLPPGRARDAEADAAAVPHAAGVLLPAPPSLPLPLPPQLLLLPAAPRPMDASVRCFAADGGTPASAAAAASCRARLLAAAADRDAAVEMAVCGRFEHPGALVCSCSCSLAALAAALNRLKLVGVVPKTPLRSWIRRSSSSGRRLGHRFDLIYSMMFSTYSSHASLGFEAASVVPRPGRAKEWPKAMSSLRLMSIPSAR